MGIMGMIGLSVLSAVFYRCGGGSKYNPKWRDWGCSLLLLLALYVQGHQVNIFVYLVSFLLSWGALSTYWKFDAIDCKWYHWFLHGFLIGLSSILFAWIGIPMFLILIRSLALGLSMMAVSELSTNVLVEEYGRGFLLVITLPILFL